MSHTTPPHAGSARAAGISRAIRRKEAFVRASVREQSVFLSGLTTSTCDDAGKPANIRRALQSGENIALNCGEEIVDFASARAKYLGYSAEISATKLQIGNLHNKLAALVGAANVR